MYQIRTLILAFLTISPAAAAESIHEEIITCARLDDASDRLSCYDQVSRSAAPTPAQPPEISSQPAEVTSPPFESISKPSKVLSRPVDVIRPADEIPVQTTEVYSENDEVPAKREAASYLRGTRQVGEHLQLTLMDSRSGEPLPDWAFEELEKGGAALEEMRGQADFIMALPAAPESDEAAVLIVACRAGITEMRFYWPDPFSGQRVQVRLRRAANVGEILTMRVKGDGFVFEAPRGLEAIRIIRGMVQAPRIQVLTGDQGAGRPRSAYFEMKDLRAALSLQARICSWSGS